MDIAEKQRISLCFRVYRAERRLTQKEFAKLLDTYQVAISLIENERFERISERLVRLLDDRHTALTSECIIT